MVRRDEDGSLPAQDGGHPSSSDAAEAVAGSNEDETQRERPSMRLLAHEPDFGPRYRVLGRLGKGGMGEVFRAYDTELKCEVALKVVRADIDGDAALARFRREIALARKITHANVLRVYDLDEHRGLRFLSMEYIDGEDLAALMRREQKVPLERALAMFRQVCNGLVAAHAQGVVHRDLKPQNVLVDRDGSVRVADFGLARSIGESGMTASGAVLGSPAYMAPEQVKGEATDERSDVYALGIMLYQLVAGDMPFHGDTPHAVMEMRLHKRPRPLSEAAPETPAYLVAIVERCLAIDPADRYRSVSEMLGDLDAGRAPRARPRRPRWLVPATGAAIALSAIGVLAWHHRGQRAGPGPARSVAAAATGAAPAVATAAAGSATAPAAASGLTTVLLTGIENRTVDPTFDGTINALLGSALRRSTVLDPVGGAAIRSLAAELGLGSIHDPGFAAKLAARDGGRVIALGGAVSPHGAGFDIAIAATDGAGKTVFAQTLRATTLADVVPVTGRLASALRIAIGEHVAERERAETGLSPSLEADHEFAVGYALAGAGDELGAIPHLQRAVAEDPTFARAHASLAITYSNTHRESDERAQDQLVLGSLDRLGERDRLTFLGDYYREVTEEYERSIDAYQQLLATWPTDVVAEGNLAFTYEAKGEFAKAIEADRRAVHDHPHNRSLRTNVPIDEILDGQFAQAIADLQAYDRDFPRPYPPNDEYLALASLFLGRRAAAVDAYAKLEALDASAGAAAQADFALAEGRLGDAQAALTKGLAADRAHGQIDAVEVDEELLAELRLRRGDKRGAREAAAKVTQQPLRELEAAVVLIAAGDDKRALATAAHFADDVAPSRRAMAELIRGEALRARGKPRQAIAAFEDALHTSEVPLGHLLLARAALDAKLYTEAYSELQACLAHPGEAAFDVHDVPTYREVPLFTYYLAKAQAGLGSPAAKASYKAFLAMMHDPDPADPYVADARHHVR